MTRVANILSAATEARERLPTLAPIWLPHWPAWMWTISLMSGAGAGLAGNGGWLPRAPESHLGHVTRLPLAPAPTRRGPPPRCHSLAASEDSQQPPHCRCREMWLWYPICHDKSTEWWRVEMTLQMTWRYAVTKLTATSS